MPDKKSTLSGTPKHYVDTDFDRIFYSTAVPIATEKPVTPENRLWVAVLGQILEDATIPQAKMSTSNGWETTAQVNARHARAQVFARFGTTAEDFYMVCDLAGFDPSFIRKCVSAAIEKNVQVTREAFAKMVLESDPPNENIPD